VREQRKNKLELKSGSNIYCIEIDSSGRTYVAVITRASLVVTNDNTTTQPVAPPLAPTRHPPPPAGAYPIRHIFSVSAATSTTPKLMAEFAAYIVAHHGPESIASGVGGLRRTLRPFLRDLAARFDDLEGIDKLAAATTKVAALQTTLSAAVHAATERSSLLEAADARTREVDTGARRMYRRSATLQRRACWARWTLCCFAIAAVVVLLALVGLLLGLNYGLLHWW